MDDEPTQHLGTDIYQGERAKAEIRGGDDNWDCTHA
jgi:hypothetical protein